MNSERPDGSELSKAAYHTLDLAKSQREVLQILQEHGPLTANGIGDHLPHSLLRNVRSRLNELEEKGVVKAMGKVRDPISNKRVILWAVRDPDETWPPTTPITKRAKLQTENDRLVGDNLELLFQVTELKDALRLNRERLRAFLRADASMLNHWQIVVCARRDGREKLNALEDEFPLLR